MAQRKEIAAVYGAGLIQGLALVTFPAASAVFTNSQDYGLSNTQYGAMFIPQVVTAVIASLLGAELRNRVGIKRIYLFGLGANLLSMALLVTSRFEMHEHSVAYDILLAATSLMGIGFGLTVPALNTLAAAFFPKKVDRAVLVLNALLGLGTALAPVFIALFVGLGIWWAMPLAVAGLILVLLLFSICLSLKDGASAHSERKETTKQSFPQRFWIFSGFILLYGICETMNGNWASLYMRKHFGSSAAISSLALSLFWGAITGGRVLFAALEKWFPERMVCRVLPLVVAAAFLSTAFAPKKAAWLGVLAFALAGLGCSALLPLTISFGQKELTAISGSVAGGLIAFYQIGYGMAAFGIGPVQKWFGAQLNIVFAASAVVALAMWAASFLVSKKSLSRA
jgi:MFS family permease